MNRNYTHSRRCHERGAAMTEAIIVVPFFIILWVGMEAFLSGWDAKMRAQVDAGAAALSASGRGDCGGAVLDSGDMEGTDDIQGPEPVEMGWIGDLAGVHPLAVAHSTGQATAQWSSEGETRTVTRRRMLVCNTKPADGFMDHVVQLIKTVILGDD